MTWIPVKERKRTKWIKTIYSWLQSMLCASYMYWLEFRKSLFTLPALVGWHWCTQIGIHSCQLYAANCIAKETVGCIENENNNRKMSHRNSSYKLTQNRDRGINLRRWYHRWLSYLYEIPFFLDYSELSIMLSSCPCGRRAFPTNLSSEWHPMNMRGIGKTPLLTEWRCTSCKKNRTKME